MPRVPGLRVVCRVTRLSYLFRQCERVLSSPAGDFFFDRVLGADERQLFVTVGLQAVAALLEGRSTLICACGALDKAFSLLSFKAQQGLIWRVVEELQDFKPYLSCLVLREGASTEVLELQVRSAKEALESVDRLEWPEGHRMLLLRTGAATLGFLEPFQSPWSLIQQCLSLLPGRDPEPDLAAALQTLPFNITIICTINPQQSTSTRLLQQLGVIVPLSPTPRSGSVGRPKPKEELDRTQHQVRRLQKHLTAALARVQALEQAQEAKELIARQALMNDMTHALEDMETAYFRNKALLVDTYEDLLSGLEQRASFADAATQYLAPTRETGPRPETKPGKRPPPSGKLKRSC